MGCDIHLKIEKRKRKNPYPDSKHEWYGVGIKGEFNSRIYGMFARMAMVRDYYGEKYKVQFKPRGLPEDMCNWSTGECFYMHITNDENAIEYGGNYCLKENAEKWINLGISKWVDENHTTIMHPDYHSFSWLTTQELRQCFDDCFKEDDGTYKEYSDYIDWLGLVSLCEGIESDGIHECRVVFAFDN